MAENGSAAAARRGGARAYISLTKIDVVALPKQHKRQNRSICGTNGGVSDLIIIMRFLDQKVYWDGLVCPSVCLSVRPKGSYVQRKKLEARSTLSHWLIIENFHSFLLLSLTRFGISKFGQNLHADVNEAKIYEKLFKSSRNVNI